MLASRAAVDFCTKMLTNWQLLICNFEESVKRIE